jgi:hypothetical protein
MSDPRAITAEGCEILVTRELRKAGVEPIGLRRRSASSSSIREHIFQFDLLGKLRAYEHSWSVLIECRNSIHAVGVDDVEALRARAQTLKAPSSILCATSEYRIDALQRAAECATLLLRVVDAQSVLVAAGTIAPGQLPSWVPEYTLQIVSARTPMQQPRLVEADQPELILGELRGP